MLMCLAFGFADRDEEDLGEEVDLDFFLLCFLGTLRRSLGRKSLNMSPDIACASVHCLKSVMCMISKKGKSEERKSYH